MSEQRIAVVGAGVSGMVAAHYLARRHRVTLFEAQDRLGGHVNTLRIPGGPDQGVTVDTGFIVYNDLTYPNFICFLEDLGIRGDPTDMSFSFSDLGRDFYYAGTGAGGLFARRGHAFSPGFWRFLLDIVRFNARAKKDLEAGRLGGRTLSDYLGNLDVSSRLLRDYLGPMTQAIWSASEADAMAYPAANFVRFFHNHGLLSRPGVVQWRYINGGSQIYVDAFRDRFPGEIRLSTPVLSVDRSGPRPLIRLEGEAKEFDAVVMAAHADQTLAMLPDADENERAALAPWRYSSNHTVLHSDETHMPPNRRAWACWNVVRRPGDGSRRPVRVIYWMNRLQRLEARGNWMVSLNADQAFAPGSVVYETTYEHPVYTMESMAAQTKLPSISGRRGTYFCGAYHGNGFHEDGARSSIHVVRNHFGIKP